MSIANNIDSWGGGFGYYIAGEWLYQDSDRYFYVNVYEGTKNGVIATFQLDNVSAKKSFGDIVYYSVSNDVPTKYSLLPGSYSNQYFITASDSNSSASIWMYLGEDNMVKKLTNSTGCGLAVDGYFLTKIS